MSASKPNLPGVAMGPDDIGLDPPPRTPRLAERLDEMRRLLARYRVEAIALHARLVALELAGNDNVAPLRRQLIESSVRIEEIARTLSDPPHASRRWPRATEIRDTDDEDDDWEDQPTLRP